MSTDPRPEAIEVIRARRAKIIGQEWETRIPPNDLAPWLGVDIIPTHVVVIDKDEQDRRRTRFVCECNGAHLPNADHAEFIAHAPLDIDTLLAELDTLRQQLAEAEIEIVRLCNARDDAEGRALDAKARVAEAEAERDRLKDALQAFCSPSAWKEIKTRVDVALLAPTQTEQAPSR